MTLQDLIKDLQRALNFHGENLDVDGDPGAKTQSALAKYDAEIVLKEKPEISPVSIEQAPPWYLEAQKYKGKVESDSAFQNYMNAFWAKIGLPGYKGLVGSARAWCALFVFMAVGVGGYKTGKLDASAISGDSFGQKIDWKANGIPRGAIVRINHEANCKESNSSHISFADGNCAPQDLGPGSNINLFGGNQGNMVKVSAFPVAHICTVSWPSADAKGNPIALPGKILKSDHCTGAPTPANESTK